jgi:hypothetical protein
MKLVIQQGTFSKSQNIEEYEVENLIQMIKTKYGGERIPPLPYELARFRIYKGVAIIFHDNRKVRTRNDWYEVRGLSSLAQHLGQKFYHSVPMQFNDRQKTEIDGLDVESKSIMIELKQTVINQAWIDFYEKKRNRLELKECFVCAPQFDDNLILPPAVRIFKINLDITTLREYYQTNFKLPEWFRPCISKRHVRFLLSNGLWYGINRKITKTAKHTESTKIIQGINLMFNRRKQPIRIYYSLAQMAIPQRDYYGKGYPLSHIIAAFDVDSDHKPHIIGSEGYCNKCLDEAKSKRELLKEKLIDLGWDVKIIHSGFKGYHVYCLNEDGHPAELSLEEIQDLLPKLRDEEGNPLTDNETFRASDGTFDLHRIFKLPHSVDVVTGIRVIENLERLKFNDNIQEIE